jgi:ankyrin repeat protein
MIEMLYLAKRREERGRPPLPWNARHRHQLPGNIKNKQPDDVAEWVEEDDVSDYHTFTVPYGAKYNAKKIEKLLFKKDLLLNAEWNQKDRETPLHRHPAFFGSVNDVIHDCCGFCPKPATDEDLAIAEEESKIYISGDISFIKDDPGRQTIGSFNPTTDEDWTEMAYVGNTQRLCQAIVDGDIEHVQDRCDQKGVDVNARDHTGRTPLQLAALCSTVEVVQCLIEHGARIISRLADGFTALHIAAQRGNAAMIKALLERSEANGEEEELKEELKKQARRAAAVTSGVSASHEGKVLKEKEKDTDHEDLVEDEDSEDSDQMTDGSFVKIAEDASTSSNLPDEEDADEPDVYVVDVLAWDSPLSPLHLAIMGGHIDCIEELVNNFGADVLLPVKLIDAYSKNARAAILTLVLAAQLTEATPTSQCLLKLGASSTQGDMNGVSTLHYIVNEGNLDVLNLLAEYDRPAASKVINSVVVSGYQHQPQVDTPLITAIEGGHQKVKEKLLELGARPTVAFDEFAQACDRKFKYVSKDPEQVRHVFEKSVEQPIIRAVQKGFPKIVIRLLDMGAHPNTLRTAAYTYVHHRSQYHGTDDKFLLDLVRKKLKALKDYIRNPEDNPMPAPPASLNPDKDYLESLEAGSYRYWLAEGDLQQAKGIKRRQVEKHQEEIDQLKRRDVKGEAEKRAAVQALIGEYEVLEQSLLSKGAKPFYEIYPDLKKSDDANQGNNGHNYYGFLETKREPYSTQQKFPRP